jgi:hypothetical protein
MFRLTTRQWLAAIGVVLAGVLMQVAWILLRPEPQARSHAAGSAPSVDGGGGR